MHFKREEIAILAGVSTITVLYVIKNMLRFAIQRTQRFLLSGHSQADSPAMAWTLAEALHAADRSFSFGNCSE